MVYACTYVRTHVCVIVGEKAIAAAPVSTAGSLSGGGGATARPSQAGRMITGKGDVVVTPGMFLL